MKWAYLGNHLVSRETQGSFNLGYKYRQRGEREDVCWKCILWFYYTFFERESRLIHLCLGLENHHVIASWVTHNMKCEQLIN